MTEIHLQLAQKGTYLLMKVASTARRDSSPPSMAQSRCPRMCFEGVARVRGSRQELEGTWGEGRG